MPIRNELLVYVSDQVAAIPTLQNKQFTLSSFDDSSPIDMHTVIAAINEFLNSIGEDRNFTVVVNGNALAIEPVSGKTLERETFQTSPQDMFSCSHCGFVTRYEVELNIHMRIHYF